uniref:Uncharacterized protein n=1 Tax=viral metagenome TaxID=1070528 RepID=A0A6C0J194_9ZZZZ
MSRCIDTLRRTPGPSLTASLRAGPILGRMSRDTGSGVIPIF